MSWTLKWRHAVRGRRRGGHGGGRRVRPRLEWLETRTLFAADTLATARSLAFDPAGTASSAGVLATPNQVDLYAVQLDPGDRVTADLGAGGPGKLAGCLRVFDGSGRQLGFKENTGGADTTLTFDALAADTYFVGVSSNGDYGYDPTTAASGDGGLTAGGYGLVLTRDSILLPEADTNFTPALAQSVDGTAGDSTIRGDAVVAGTYVDGATEYYAFGVGDTGSLTARVTPADGTAFLPRLRLYGPAGQLLIQADASDAGDGTAALTQYLQPGTYRLAVSAVADSADPAADLDYVLSTAYTTGTPPSQPLSVGNGPEFLAAGDFNHDGNLDVVTADRDQNAVSVLLGNGDHTFRQAVTYNVGTHPVALAVGSFRDDGNLDVVTANAGDNTVSVLLGNGDGTFRQPVTYAVGKFPFAVAVGNFDGNPDIVTANNGDNTVSVLLGNGDGTFGAATAYAVGKGPYAVAVGNFDGQDDVVTANYLDNTVSVLLGNGDGTFQPPATYAVGRNPYSVSVATIDGQLDLLTTNFSDNTVSVLAGNGDGTFQRAVAYKVGINPTAAVAVEIDGRSTILATNKFSNSVSVLVADAAGTFRVDATYRVGYQPLDLVLGDFGNDGNLDVATVNYIDHTVSVLPGNGDGTFRQPAALATGLRPFAAAVGDFNRDGNPDVVTADNGDGTASVLLGNGDGTFRQPVPYPVGTNPVGVAVGSLTRDGNVDVVVANYGSASVSVLLGRGDGTFLPAVSYAAGTNPEAVTLGDLNGDGNLDIVAVDANYDARTGTYGAGTVSVLLGVGDGTFRKAVSWAVGALPRGVAVGDFNGDGRPDVVTANENDNTVSVLLGDGKGGFRKAVAYRVGSKPLAVAVGTVGGRAAVVTANNGDNTVSVLLGNGDGTFGAATAYAVGQSPVNVAVGHFTADGRLDVVTANYLDDTVSVLLGTGDGAFQPAVDTNVGDSPEGLAVGDFNRDGNLDVVTANLGDSSVSVLLGSGAGPFQKPIAYRVGARPVGVSVDYDANDNDVVATANADGTVSVLLGNVDGTAFQTAATYPVGATPVAVAVYSDSNSNPAVFTANADGTVSVFAGHASDALSPAVSYPVGATPVAIAVVNDTNDNPDVVTANGVAGTVSVLSSNLDGTFGPAKAYPAGDDPVAVAADSDANTDDVIVTANGDGSVSVLVGDPDGTTFALPVRYELGAVPVAVALGCDAGNNLVIVTANRDDTVSVLRSNSSTDPTDAFYLAATYPVGATPAAVTLGTDAQSNLVIVTANSADDSVSVLHGDADDAFGPAVRYPVGDHPVGVVVANDGNGNGNPDIFTADAAGNTVSELIGNTPFRSYTAQTGVVARAVPFLQDLTGVPGVADSLVLDSNGDLLFRAGEASAAGPGAARFRPPTVINGGSPARDATVFETATGWAVAAVNEAGNSVTIYTWDPARHSFQSTAGFSTGNFPLRIAAADLTGREVDGHPLDGDLVVTNNFDNTVTVAFQQDDGTFATLTQPVGAAPSDIAFVPHAGTGATDVVVSGQASGDVTVLLNDGTPDSPPTFDEQYRYRAGGGPFGTDDGTGTTTVLSQLETAGLAAGNFTGGGDDVVVLNRGDGSFTLLPGVTEGAFAGPQLENTYATGARPAAVAAVTLPGDALASVAVLVPDAGQVWVYRNRGDGTFAPPVKFSAGDAPTGFSVATVIAPPAADFEGPTAATVATPALLVGNAFGDVLTLLYAGAGRYAPDRAGLQHLPLAVGTVAATGQQFAVVADQKADRVSLYYLVDAATGRFGRPVSIGAGAGQAPLLAPGAVQTFTVRGDPNPYLAVANSLSNTVVVYHYDPAAGAFDRPQTVPVGDDPVAVTVAQGANELTGSGIPDLLVANQGSNDVSVLIGSAAGGPWTATAYQRLRAGGQGPVGVAVVDAGSASGPNLMVTNGDGTITTIPGIGSAGHGSGFFQNTNETALPVTPLAPAPPRVDGDTVIAAAANGDLISVTNGVVTTTALAAAVLTLGGGGGLPLFAGLANDTVVGLDPGPDGQLVPDGMLFETDGEPTALEVAAGAAGTEVFYTVSGGAQPFFHAFGPPVGPTPQPPMPIVEVVAGQPLAFVPALVSGVTIGVTVLSDTAAADFAGEPLLARAANQVPDGGGGGAAEDADAAAGPQREGEADGREVREALDKCLEQGFSREQKDLAGQMLDAVLNGMTDWWRPPPPPAGKAKGPGEVRSPTALEKALSLIGLRLDGPARPAPGPAGPAGPAVDAGPIAPPEDEVGAPVATAAVWLLPGANPPNVGPAVPDGDPPAGPNRVGALSEAIPGDDLLSIAAADGAPPVAGEADRGLTFHALVLYQLALVTARGRPHERDEREATPRQPIAPDGNARPTRPQ